MPSLNVTQACNAGRRALMASAKSPSSFVKNISSSAQQPSFGNKTSLTMHHRHSVESMGWPTSSRAASRTKSNPLYNESYSLVPHYGDRKVRLPRHTGFKDTTSSCSERIISCQKSNAGCVVYSQKRTVPSCTQGMRDGMSDIIHDGKLTHCNSQTSNTAMPFSNESPGLDGNVEKDSSPVYGVGSSSHSVSQCLNKSSRRLLSRVNANEELRTKFSRYSASDCHVSNNITSPIPSTSAVRHYLPNVFHLQANESG